MKICIVSDSHDHREYLAAAVADARRLGAGAVIHCGDLVAPSTLHAIIPLGLPIHLVHGNNIGDLFHLAKLAHKPENHVHYYGQDASLLYDGERIFVDPVPGVHPDGAGAEIRSRRIFLVHYPHYAKAMALTGDYDLVCNGHEHRAVVERIKNIKGGETRRVDPGTVGGVSAPATYVLGDLEKMEFEIRPVPLPESPSNAREPEIKQSRV